MDSDLFPLIITNEDISLIESTIDSYLQHPRINTVLFMAPYISSYFINMIERSNARLILALINKNAPKYTVEAMKKLRMLDYRLIRENIAASGAIKTDRGKKIPFILTPSMKKSLEINREVYIKEIQSPDGRKKNVFVHMKLLVPYYFDRNTKKLTPECVFSGSVNWTAGGIKNNDEILIILRDRNSVKKCVSILETYWNTGLLK